MSWPLPALLAWLAAWLLHAGLQAAGLPRPMAFAAAVLAAAVLALPLGSTPWRRLFIGLGFPLSALAAGGAQALPGWAWALPLALLLWLYPRRSWADAPLFPTPVGALDGLAALAPVPRGSSILDAGCGLGDGLLSLHREWPSARIEGIEWSRPLVWACRLRCRFATVRRGDLWADDWSRHALVYLFQRPESMPRAVAKAQAELRPGAWLASLEFEAPGLQPVARIEAVPGKPVWLYQAPLRPR